jgi:hypothetical protein
LNEKLQCGKAKRIKGSSFKWTLCSCCKNIATDANPIERPWRKPQMMPILLRAMKEEAKNDASFCGAGWVCCCCLSVCLVN